MEIVEHAGKRRFTQSTHGPKVDHHQMLPRLQSRAEVQFSTGMPYKRLQVKLYTDPITWCDTAHLQVTLKQVNGATLNMPPLLISSLWNTRKHEATQLLLDSCLSLYIAVELIRAKHLWVCQWVQIVLSQHLQQTIRAKTYRQHKGNHGRFFWRAQCRDTVHQSLTY